MKNLIIKDLLEKVHMTELPTNSYQIRELITNGHTSKVIALMLLDEYPKYSELFMVCLYEIISYYEFDKNTIDSLIAIFTKDYQEQLLTETQYYLIIQWLIDNDACYVNYSREYLQIINKCDNEFIKANLSKSISRYEIPIEVMDEYHHLINWKIFQKENDIYELFYDAAVDSEYIEEYNEIMLSLVTKDYLKHNLNYDDVLHQCIYNNTSVDDDVLIHMLRDYDIYHINFYTLVEYCRTFTLSSKVINFICSEYQHPTKTSYWTINDLSQLGLALLKKLDLTVSKDIIIDNLPFFLKFDECKTIIKKHFKYNLLMYKKIYDFEKQQK